jgi:CheY-like chemotaxis protein
MNMNEQPARPPIRIVLADDHPLLRSGVRAALETNGDLVVVGEVDNGHQIASRCRETLPDVLLLDLQMPGPGPLAIIAELRTFFPTMPILVLTAHTDRAHVRAMLAAGRSGRAQYILLLFVFAFVPRFRKGLLICCTVPSHRLSLRPHSPGIPQRQHQDLVCL